ncbi:MAG: cation transporter [Gammaproteobacteria bacterium]|nr:cation transporter [Gammaproteobacteria bacterium]
MNPSKHHTHHKIHFIKKAAWVAIFTNGLLGLLKTIGGFLFQSHALIADGLHSLSDLVIDFMVIIGGHWSHKAADEEHPYGHQRIETAMTLMISLFLILTGVIIAYDALIGLFHPLLTKPSIKALLLAGISAVANEGLFRYTQYLNRDIKTDLLEACAWHHRSDALTAGVVVLGILLSIVGLHSFDHIAAIIVGGMIVKMGWDYTWESIQQLIDRGVDTQTHQKINATIKKIPGVDKVHQLRTRLMGQDIYVDAHILVDPFISVSEGHFIALKVHHELLKKFPAIRDVTIHVDPEDDEDQQPNLLLPDSTEISEKLIKHWRKKYPNIMDWTVHYLNGEIQLDLIVNDDISALETFKNQLHKDCQHQNWTIKTIRILREHVSIAILPPI